MSTSTALFLAVLLTVSAIAGAALPSAPPPGVDCTTLVLNLADCLSFVSAGSVVDKPEGSCCPGLKMVLKSHADCLCEAFKNSAQFGVTLNVSKALTLPAACHVSSPSISNCGLSLVAGAPASAPVSAMPPSMTAGSPTSSSGLTKGAAPAPALASSGSIAITYSMRFLVIMVMAVSFSF